MQWVAADHESRASRPFALRRLRRRGGRRGTSLASDLQDLLGGNALSEGSLPLLGMGLDVPDGVLGLDRDGDLTLAWTKKPSDAFYRDVVRTSRAVADALGARFLEDPVTTMLRRFVTVHPLGGCAMGLTAQHGVVDEWDVSTAIPVCTSPTGRSCPGRSVPTESHHRCAGGPLCRPDDRRHEGPVTPMTTPTLRFNERMSGYLSAADRMGGDDEAAYEAGRAQGTSIQFETTITHSDLPALLEDASSPATLTGTVLAPMLCPSPLDVVGEPSCSSSATPKRSTPTGCGTA